MLPFFTKLEKIDLIECFLSLGVTQSCHFFASPGDIGLMEDQSGIWRARSLFAELIVLKLKTVEIQDAADDKSSKKTASVQATRARLPHIPASTPWKQCKPCSLPPPLVHTLWVSLKKLSRPSKILHTWSQTPNLSWSCLGKICKIVNPPKIMFGRK